MLRFRRASPAQTKDPRPLRRTRGVGCRSTSESGPAPATVVERLPDFACTPTVTAIGLMLIATAVVLILCPKLHRARMSKLAAKRALPSYSFEHLLRADECRQVVEQIQALDLFVDARTGGRGGDGVRRCAVARLPRNQFDWIYGRVEAGLALANSHAWGYSSLGHLEDLQVAWYQSHPHGQVGHYFWHTDAIREGTDYFRQYDGASPSWSEQNQNRLLSISVQLSDGSGYIGGDLQVGSTNVTRAIGSAVVFPAYMLHRVHPMQEGERFSLVAWLRGEDGTGRYWADAERSYQNLSEIEPETRPFVRQFLATSERHSQQ